jgi:hypothetical protein
MKYRRKEMCEKRNVLMEVTMKISAFGHLTQYILADICISEEFSTSIFREEEQV